MSNTAVHTTALWEAIANNIVQAQLRLKDIVVNTPLIKNFNASQKYSCNVFYKREDMQTVRSFKLRGAYNKILSLTPADRERGVVCASAGNHAQGFAFACSSLKIKGKVFMPHPTPKQKIQKVKHFGGDHIEIILCGDNYDEAYTQALHDRELTNAVFIHPFDDRDIIEGQGTIGKEILDSFEDHLDYIILPVGGGGLISGVGSYIKAFSPDTQVIAVEALGAPALHDSLRAGHRVCLENIDTFADGIAVKQIGQLTFDICKDIVDDVVLVPEGKICSTILSLYNDEAIVVEPAGAAPIAALDILGKKIAGKNVAVVLSGGNNDVNRTQEIKERALLFEGLKHYFIINFPQRAGALRDFLGVLGPHDDITHFQYTKKNSRTSGPALVGLELKHAEDFNKILKRMEEANMQYQHINNNPMLFDLFV